jgi:hypothetical protein
VAGQSALVLGLLAILTDCSRPARPEIMAPKLSGDAVVSADYRRLAVGKVEGGKATGRIGAKVSNDEFLDALQRTLRSAGVLAADSSATATVDVQILEVHQPSSPFPPATVTSTVEYRVASRLTGATLARFVVESRGRAGLTDAFIGMNRLRLANEAAIRLNLSCFVERLAKAGTPSGNSSSSPEALCDAPK